MAEDKVNRKKNKQSNTLTWSTWAEKYSYPPGTGPTIDDNVIRIFNKDVSLYGFSPRYDEFCLVVCKHCKQTFKLQALYKHYERRHTQRLVQDQITLCRKEYFGPGEIESSKIVTPVTYARPIVAGKTLPQSHLLKELSLAVGKEIGMGKERGEGSFHITSQTVHIHQKTLDGKDNFDDIIRKRKIETQSQSSNHHLSDFKSTPSSTTDAPSPSSSTTTTHSHTKIKTKKCKKLKMKEDKINKKSLSSALPEVVDDEPIINFKPAKIKHHKKIKNKSLINESDDVVEISKHHSNNVSNMQNINHSVANKLEVIEPIHQVKDNELSETKSKLSKKSNRIAPSKSGSSEKPNLDNSIFTDESSSSPTKSPKKRGPKPKKKKVPTATLR